MKTLPLDRFSEDFEDCPEVDEHESDIFDRFQDEDDNYLYDWFIDSPEMDESDIRESDEDEDEIGHYLDTCDLPW